MSNELNELDKLIVIAVIIWVMLMIVYIPIGIFVYKKYCSDKQNSKPFDRIMVLAFECYFIPIFVGLIVTKLTGLIGWTGLFFGFVGIFFSTFILILFHQSTDSYQGMRIENRRKKIDNMPDSPKKQKMEREQEFIENIWKDRY